MKKASELMQALAAFFPENAIGWLPGATTQDGNRALAMPYISARDVMDRLDEAVGPANWFPRFEIIHDQPGVVICQLSVRLDDEWITKQDLGASNDQDNMVGKQPNQYIDRSKQYKSACSDSLKRAAIHFGIGRYLYAVDAQWCAYDSKKRRFVEGQNDSPRMPQRFLPSIDTLKGKQAEKAAVKTDTKPSEEKPAEAAKPATDDKIPKTGAELKKRLDAAEKKHKGLFEFVSNCGQLRGFPADPAKWKGQQLIDAISFASELMRRRDPANKVMRITQEQDAKIRELSKSDPETILTACKAAGVFAGDHMTKVEADKVILLLQGSQS